MRVTVSGRSGLTNAYTSVLSATGSLAVCGASRCDDIPDLPHRTARASRAARAGSRNRTLLVPAKTSSSPAAASRRYTTREPAFAGPAAVAVDAPPFVPGLAEATTAPAPVAAVSPTAHAPAAPRSTERRDM